MSIFKNISVYRKLLGFTQEEFSFMIGISQIYLSHIETYRKPLTNDIADKIAQVVSLIVEEVAYHEANLKNAEEPDLNVLDVISTELIRIGHDVGKYSPEIQDKVLKLLVEITVNRAKLEYMLETGQEPPESDLLNDTQEHKQKLKKSAEASEIIIKKMLKLSSSKEVLKSKKEEAKKKIKLRGMKSK